MSIDTFIFSNERKDRLRRHLLFWLAYCSYFYIQSIPPKSFPEFFIGKTYFIALMNLICFAPVFIGAVYFFIYYLLPRVLQRKRYFMFILSFLLVYAIGTFINFFTATLFLYYTHYFPMTFQHKIATGNYNARWGMVIATIALGIKLSKNFYLQQKENLALVKRKTQSEMQLEKARIHPEMLLRSLDTIHKREATKSPSMILDLSELLSYSLYEVESESAPLEKELLQLKHLLSLEKNNANGVANICLQIEGTAREQSIVPMTIVKLVEETLSLLHKWDLPVDMFDTRIELTPGKLSLNLSVIYQGDTENGMNDWYRLIERAQQRMKMQYAEESFKLTATEAKDELSLELRVRLAENIAVENNTNAISHEPA
ncbi:MAG: histidine kinase [Flavisolibacter sp.]